MKPYTPTWPVVPQKIREGLGKRVARYLKSGAFSTFCRRQLSIRWYHPLHLLAWWFTPNLRRSPRRPVEVLPQPVLAVPLMWNTTISENRKTVAPALLMGTFDLTTNGVRELMKTATQFGKPESPTQQAEYDRIMADQEYQEFRCRPIPSSYGAPKSIFLLDENMSQANLLIDEKSKVDAVAPFVLVAATSPDGGPFQIMPVKIARWVIKSIEKERGPLGLNDIQLWA